MLARYMLWLYVCLSVTCWYISSSSQCLIVAQGLVKLSSSYTTGNIEHTMYDVFTCEVEGVCGLLFQQFLSKVKHFSQSQAVMYR